MEYSRIVKAVFESRPNRFIAHVYINGKLERVHVKNTGRCKELLVPGCTVYLSQSDNPARNTAYDLVTVQKGGRLINMDAQAPNAVVKEWLAAGGLPGVTVIRPEFTYDQSRFDFYLECSGHKAFLEVKGVTLEENGVVYFPDAPTLRGTKHLHELMKAKEEGYDAYIFLCIQMENVDHFEPNRRTDPNFADALVDAQKSGVKLLAYDCKVTPGSMQIGKKIEVRL